jgi:hypothetical protein
MYTYELISTYVFMCVCISLCMYVCMCIYKFLYLYVYSIFDESTICCRCIFLILISIGPDAGVNFLNARESNRSRSNKRFQVVDKSKLVIK